MRYSELWYSRHNKDLKKISTSIYKHIHLRKLCRLLSLSLFFFYALANFFVSICSPLISIIRPKLGGTLVWQTDSIPSLLSSNHSFVPFLPDIVLDIWHNEGIHLSKDLLIIKIFSTFQNCSRKVFLQVCSHLSLPRIYIQLYILRLKEGHRLYTKTHAVTI